MKKLNRIFALICFISSIVVVLLPNFFLPVCGPMENGMYMACHYSSILTSVIFVILAVVALLQIIVNRKGVHLVGSGLTIVGVLINYLVITRRIPIPTPVQMGGMAEHADKMMYGLCSSKDMACHNSYRIIFAIAAVIAAVAGVNFLKCLITKGARKN